MSIKLNYHTFDITKKKRTQGGYDLSLLKEDLYESVGGVPDEIRYASGIYVYYRTTKGGGWKADYVGKNSTDNLLGESLSKTTYLANDILPRSGNHKILYITCSSPQGMRDKNYSTSISNLESYLITVLRLRRHPLLNVQHARKKPSFNFNLGKKNHNGQRAFKNLAGKQSIWL